MDCAALHKTAVKTTEPRNLYMAIYILFNKSDHRTYFPSYETMQS